jgi:hypothetical protein
MKTFTTAEKIDNVVTFMFYFRSIPEENVIKNLHYWQPTVWKDGESQAYAKDRVATCGTIACAGGWLPFMPEFAAMGVKMDDQGRPLFDGCYVGADTAEILFGDDRLFNSRWGHPTDQPEWDTDDTDHDAVMRRFRQQLKILLRTA